MKQKKYLQTIYVICLVGLCLQTTRAEDEQPQQQFAQFAENLADFFPSQSFQFDLNATEQLTLMFWPLPQTQFIRGLYYITSSENGGLFVGCESSEQMKKTFFNKKIGVFNVQYPGTGDMKLIFKSELHKLTVYISYEFVLKKTAEKPKTSENITQQQNQLFEVGQKFEKVQRTIAGQQTILDGIVKSQLADVEKIEDQINSKSFKVILQTVIVFISGFASLWMIKKQLMKNGYQIVI